MALLGWENAVETAAVTLAASSEATGYTAQMLRIPMGAPSVAWQTEAGVTSAYILLTSPASVAWRAVCLTRANFTTAATIRVRVGTVANITSAPDYDSGVVSAGVAVGVGQALHILPSAVSAVACRIDIADTANPDGRLNIPLLYAGPGTEFNVSSDSKVSIEARRQDVTTRGGQVFADALSRARAWAFSIALINDSAATWLDPIEAAAAAGGNVLFVPRVGHSRASAECVFGLLAPGARGFVGASGLYRNWSATISERL